jgi:ubiquitin-like protein 5
MGSLSAQKDPLEMETEKERLQRRERGEVPARFGGTREQGVRNTMTMNPNLPAGGVTSAVGSLGRKNDPLDRMPGKGGDRASGDKMRDERIAAMGKPQAVAPGAPAAGR